MSAKVEIELNGLIQTRAHALCREIGPKHRGTLFEAIAPCRSCEAFVRDTVRHARRILDGPRLEAEAIAWEKAQRSKEHAIANARARQRRLTE